MYQSPRPNSYGPTARIVLSICMLPSIAYTCSPTYGSCLYACTHTSQLAWLTGRYVGLCVHADKSCRGPRFQESSNGAGIKAPQDAIMIVVGWAVYLTCTLGHQCLVHEPRSVQLQDMSPLRVALDMRLCGVPKHLVALLRSTPAPAPGMIPGRSVAPSSHHQLIVACACQCIASKVSCKDVQCLLVNPVCVVTLTGNSHCVTAVAATCKAVRLVLCTDGHWLAHWFACGYQILQLSDEHNFAVQLPG